MKLTTLLIFIGFLQVNATAFGQQHINLTANNMSLEKLFKQLEKQSGYSFFYKAEVLKNLPNVNVEINDASIDEVLQKCFAGKPLDYLIVDKSVVIRRKDQTQATVKNLPPNTYLSGTIVDDHQQPLPGVSIKVKGTNFGWVTNNQGQFTAVVITPNAVLQISFIGYITQEVVVKDLKSPFTISLKEDISKLDEVQVIAYGQTTKRLNIGDQTTVTAADIAKYPSVNVLDALQASVPGMNIISSTGKPGGQYSVKIRGNNGINNGTGTDPLYIVDGIPYQGGGYASQNSSVGQSPGAAGVGGDALDFINPLDIESVNVLKDADATAIYGSRAANGVILITTKKGKAGSTKFDVNVYQGIAKATRLPDYLNTQQYLQLRHEAKKNDNAPILPTDYDLNGTWDTTRYTNWGKELIGGTAHTTNAQMSVSGGNANTQFLISGNYNRESNLMPIGGNNQTASTHFSINNTSSNNKFSILFTGGYTYNNNSIPQVDLTSSASMSPVAPALYNPDGTLNFQNNTFDNPLVAGKKINSTTSSNLMGSTVLSYKPIAGLEFKATLGYNKQQVNEFLGAPVSSYSPVVIKQQQLTTGSSNFTYNNNSTWSIEPQVNYNLKLGAKGQLNSTLGSSLQNQTAETTELAATGYTSDLLIRSITGGTAIQAINNVPYDYDVYKFSAGFGRLSYNWANKYLVNVSGRYDGSSRFGEDKRFHLFGAAGAGWIFSEEEFVKKNLPFLSFGKLKATYGVTGNDQIANGIYLDSYYSGSPYQGIPSLTPGNEPNPNIGWETTKKAELGLELHFLRDRISLEADYYRNRTTDVLLQYPLSIVTGFNKITQNLPANIQNTGLELTLNTTNIRTKDFSWSSSILLTVPRNKLISYSNLASSALANNYIIGQPVTIVHAYRFAGVNPQTGVYQFYDRNGKIVANPDPSVDKTAIINVDPKVYGALQNTFTYKGFSLNFTFRFIEQNGRNAFGQQSGLPAGITAINSTTMVLSRWQKPGDITDIQRYGTSFLLFTPLTYAIQSDKGYGDASYIRLQNLAFSYQFAPLILQKMHLQNLRIYLQGSNLLTISKYGNFDPENQSGLSLPPLRIFTTGVQFTF